MQKNEKFLLFTSLYPPPPTEKLIKNTGENDRIYFNQLNMATKKNNNNNFFKKTHFCQWNLIFDRTITLIPNRIWTKSQS